MSHKERCAHCRRLFRPNPRLKEQQSYCSSKACQRARKSQWQKLKIVSDPDYRDTKRISQQHWQEQHPDYWRRYRMEQPDYCRRNRLLQKERDGRRRERNLAKMDALRPFCAREAGTYYLVSEPLGPLAKKDSFMHKVLIIPAG